MPTAEPRPPGSRRSATACLPGSEIVSASADAHGLGASGAGSVELVAPAAPFAQPPVGPADQKDYRLFLAAADVQTDKTAPAVTEFVKELTRIRTPATPEEAERARSYAALGYASEFETTQQVAQHMVEKVVYDLPDGFFEQCVPKALRVDPATLQKAAETTVDPERIAVVVVGDRSKIEAPLRALNLGTVRNLTIDEVMGPAPKVD